MIEPLGCLGLSLGLSRYVRLLLSVSESDDEVDEDERGDIAPLFRVTDVITASGIGGVTDSELYEAILHS